ncbi:ARABIDOPSIS THALIANA RESPIRATORY BURST OXIDASE HOMOLOG F, respiratory burst oxidase protein F [Hibiscus trionum]|uniref:ARABIDOPSIS THALIANA RESPIRATORY BURST OXIDASE HOMOLOG F, respiratory burst oxidase protein F n=1 Tax=Hibiscus trionum TaxID=183268 RepID=A0A9W7J5Q0_HIBTR|nr:ARABIDOPSIS THALIANA RESPIRATORY BURST OXIDASE HOMOLOG F, respiratory burst oxidase protein F [Hibiscus trionum]
MEIDDEEPHSDSDSVSITISSSLSSSSSSCSASFVPLPFSPVQQAAGSAPNRLLHRLESGGMLSLVSWSNDGERLRFVDTEGNEWRNVENRFDRLASTAYGGNGPQRVVKWSDFGACIGMRESGEFVNELLRALIGGRREWKRDITKDEAHHFWNRMTDPWLDSRIHLLFHLCDRNMDGRIHERDIKQVISLICPINKLSIKHGEAEEYAALIMEALDVEHQGFIQPSEFEALFKASLPKVSTISYQKKHRRYQKQEPLSKAEILFRSNWRRAWIILLWLMICFTLFTWKFIQYSHRSAFQVMGYCLSTAKGAAETLKFNMALILLPVCRNTLTWLRKNPGFSSVIPFNDNINFHKLIAGGIVIGVILHGGTHLACDFPRISGSDRSVFRQTIAARFGYQQPSYLQILATTEVATGIAMVILMMIAFSLATKWPRRRSPSLPRSVRKVTGYNTFWYSHHLFVLVYALLIVHSMFLFLTVNFIEKTTWMYIAIPVLLYAGERTIRALRSGFSEVKILKVSLYPGKVLYLRLQKPEGFRHKSGMYIFIQCPQISPFEWHPFSLSCGPEDDFLSVHIRTLGDWSYQLYSLFQEAKLTGPKQYPKIYIDGPYGASSQDHIKYDIVVMVGLGIGITPFISILKDIATRLKNSTINHAACGDGSPEKTPLKAYLYWVTREQSSFNWFMDFMKEIAETNQKQSVVEVFNFLTSVYEEGDARSALITVIQSLYQAKYGTDIVSRTPVHTRFGRPNWFNIFSKLARRHRGARIGVFYCGPKALAREMQKLCTKFSTKTNTRFVFHKEYY